MGRVREGFEPLMYAFFILLKMRLASLGANAF